jgi:hypothetical protein
MNVHQTIIKGIKEQLFLNNYLVLPNFGGFVLKQVSSHFSASGGMLMPPSKNISFNSQLKQNDGILALWLQNQLNCDNNTAILHLNDFAEYCKSILANKGRLTIEGVGFFHTDFENNICFEPHQQTNFLSSSFGLCPVSVKEIEIPQKAETIFVDRVITKTEVESETKKVRNYRRMAVVAVSGAFLLSCLFLVVSNNKISGKLQASLFGKEQKATYTPFSYQDLNLKNLSTNKKDYVADANGIATLELENNKTLAVQALENISSETASNINHMAVKSRSAHKNFEIVLGCFSVLDNANRMVKKLKAESVSAELSGQNNKGLYIVSSGSFDTKEDAAQQLSQIKTTCPNAWIKKAE